MIMERWAEYFEALLNKDNRAPENEEMDAIEMDVLIPTLEEVEKYIKKQKNNKAAGVGEIPAELLKVGGKQLYRALHNLISKIWTDENLPEE